MTKRCVHDLFAEQVGAFSERTALVHGDRRISYAELDRWSNRLAHRLHQAGVRPDDVVAICTSRSFEMVASVLAVHKAGAAYLPIDPALPPERLSFMLSDSRSRIVLTQRSVWQESFGSALPLFIEEVGESLSDKPLEIAATPEHLAYVIYTSGSTGRPKGIEMPHWVLANLLEWQCASYTWRPDARWAQSSAFFFDASFVEIYATLISGGTLYLVSEELRTDFHGLCALLRNERVERTYIPMVALGQLAEAAQRADAPFPADLREVIVSGEQLKIGDAVRKLFERLGPDAVLHNQYGPAETHVVTAHAMSHPSSAWPNLPSIGTAISHSRIYLLDQQLAPVPDNAPGELYIGETVARGYRGRPDITAERFLPDPFAAPGARMYRSGDIAVRQQDGSYTFQGRADFQLKIRGYRVEPLEIELALCEHADVVQAAVAAYEDAAGQNSLVGYVVRSTEEADSPTLRRFLQDRLPNYMVPALFVFVDKLPLTPSGKLDRQALPKPDLERPKLETDLAEPIDPVDVVLVGLWCETLGTSQIGVNDDFFELGGHSLMAIGLLSKVREAFQIEFPLLSLFEAPTVAGMSESLALFAENPDELTASARRWLARSEAK